MSSPIRRLTGPLIAAVVAGSAVGIGGALVMPARAWAAGAPQDLVTAAAEQDAGRVGALLKGGANVNGRRADGATALLYAAHWNDIGMADALLRAGADPNLADDYGVTPLARACENASLPMVERLLKAGARVDAAQASGLTPLMLAAATGDAQIAKRLIAGGAAVDATTRATKNTALMWAVTNQHADTVKLLVEAQANVRAATDKGFTPLLLAARNGDIEMARILLAAGAGVNDGGPDGMHVLPYAIVAGRPAFAEFVLEQGADPNGVMAGVPALHAAAGPVGPWLADWNRRHGGDAVAPGGAVTAADRLRLVKALLARGANPNSRITNSALFMGFIGYPTKGAFEPYSCGTGDLYGATPLWVAAYAANEPRGAFTPDTSPTQVMRALLGAGADHRLTTDDGTTPLMVAAGLGRATFAPIKRGARSESAEEAVTLLIEAGADVNAVNEADFAAIHGAAYRGLNEVLKILVDRGADINARDFRGRTPYRLAEGNKQSFQFQLYPETAEYIKSLGANTRLGLPGEVQERLRDTTDAAAARREP